MKIIAIRIKNLASLEGLTEIDFTSEPLCSAGIFAITGATGSGKSTILDALCLALYAKTPRYLQARESGVSIQDVPGSLISLGDVRAILRDGTGDGFAEVDFVGVDNQRYRSRWSVKRARGKSEGAIQQDSMLVTNLDSNLVVCSKKVEACKEIERLIGLNFDQFTRSVLLAQGDFTAFLKADKDVKASLLEKLTGSYIYSEISKRVFNKYKEAEQEVEALNSQRDAVELLSDEMINAFNQRNSTILSDINSETDVLKIINTGIQWHQVLQRLQDQLEEAKTGLNNAVQLREQSAERYQQLALVEKMQQTRSFVNEYHAATERIKQLEEQLDQANKNVDQHQSLVQEIDKKIFETQADYKKAKDEQLSATGDLKKARELDILLKEKNAQLVKVENDLEIIKQDSLEKQSACKENEEIIIYLKKEIEQLVQWKEKNIERQPVAENIGLVNTRLENATSLLQQVKKFTGTEASNNTKIAERENTLKSISEKEKEYSTNIEQLTRQIQEQQKQLNDTSIEQLEEYLQLAQSNLHALVDAQASWKLLYSDTLKLQDEKESLSKLSHELEKYTERIKEVHQQLPSLEEKKRSSANRFSQAQLKISENIEQLRQQLQEGEECPVCGSTDHPFRLHDPQKNIVLDLLEQEKINDEKNFQNLLKEQSGLLQLINNHQLSITGKEKQTGILDQAVTEKTKAWQASPVYLQCKSIDDSIKTRWLQTQEEIARQELAQLQSKLAKAKLYKQELDQLQQDHYQLEKNLADTRGKIKIVQEEIKHLHEQNNTATSGKLDAEEALKKIILQLDGFFRPGWMESWKADPVKFSDTINLFEQQWKENKSLLDDKQSQLNSTTITAAHLKEQFEKSLVEKDKQGEELATLQKAYAQLLLERNILFNGRAIEDVERELEEALNRSQHALEQYQEEKNNLSNHLASLTTKKDSIHQNIKETQSQKVMAMGRMESWLGNYNQQNPVQIDVDVLMSMLKYDHEWIEQEREALSTLDKAVMHGKTLQSDREHSLTQHHSTKVTDHSLEELEAQQIEQEDKIKSLNEEKISIQIQLEQDALNKKRAGQLLKVIEEKKNFAENWARLNEMIGSADGKKFRQVAQEYTLDVLLSYANMQLEALTKRYHLQRIPSSLSLQVIDKDMGDEIRSVFSLSGGESFLVSLALALGLASLSSSKMKVESLFIDEGFGSLDPSTLNIAMDALERLHNQGRKVGVISHVQEMTERIPTQVKVIKQSSGKSRVEII